MPPAVRLYIESLVVVSWKPKNAASLCRPEYDEVTYGKASSFNHCYSYSLVDWTSSNDGKQRIFLPRAQL
jgi:hypothetical protein